MIASGSVVNARRRTSPARPWAAPISATQTRAKTHNLRRDPRASLHVQGRDRYEYLVAEGTVEFIEGDGLAEALRHYYRKVRGDHPDWAEYDAAMIKEQRLLLSLSVDRAYGPLR